MEEVEFLYDQDLISEFEKLIKEAKHMLILISPFIDLSPAIKDALLIQQAKKDFKLFVLFGKSEGNYVKSAKKESLRFLMDFPDVEIRYNERLHAKYYQNDCNYIITSMNMYNFSLSKNIEVGVKGEYASKGIIARAIEVPIFLMAGGMKKVKENVLGLANSALHPTLKFEDIFKASVLLYKTRPILKEKQNLAGKLGFKELGGKEILTNDLENYLNKLPIKETTKENIKTISATKIGEQIGKTKKEVEQFMEEKGLIKSEQITLLGLTKGLSMKIYKDSNYISYPINLSEVTEILAMKLSNNSQ